MSIAVIISPSQCKRRPLRIYLGMEFVDFHLSIFSLSITFTDFELMSNSPITLGLLAFFPSAIVQNYKPSLNFPASKITVEKIKIGLRMGLIVRNFHKHDGTVTILSQFMKQILNLLFQRPIVSIKVNGATLHVEKAYLAPRPPQEMMNSATSMPSAVAPSVDIGSEIPVFDQDYILDFFRLDELRYADAVTFWIERWSEYETVVTILYGCPFNVFAF